MCATVVRCIPGIYNARGWDEIVAIYNADTDALSCRVQLPREWLSSRRYNVGWCAVYTPSHFHAKDAILAFLAREQSSSHVRILSPPRRLASVKYVLRNLYWTAASIPASVTHFCLKLLLYTGRNFPLIFFTEMKEISVVWNSHRPLNPTNGMYKCVHLIS